jgi:glycerol-3-phosphate acyltransferase PlsX
MTRPVIAIDIMGGDVGPTVTVPSAYRFAHSHSDCDLVLYGQCNELDVNYGDPPENIKWVHVDAEVHMGEKLSSVFRRSASTSMGQALLAQANGQAHATVSAGNTGALMALAYKILGNLEGILRPAIMSTFPTLTADDVFILDLGANTTCQVEHLQQFAMIGNFYAQSSGVNQPRIGLLNIGVEANKGHKLVKETHAALQKMNLNYVGFVEPNQIYSNQVDVIVCDGFTGNILLKSCEGTSKFLKYIYKEAFGSSILGMLASFLLRNKLRHKLKKYDPKFRNGAMIVGLDGIVVKSHGSACVDAFQNALKLAYQSIKHQPNQQLKSALATMEVSL